MMKTDFCSTGGAIEKDLIVVNPSRECYSCASTETYVNKQRGKPHYYWYGNGVANQYFCLNCENKYYKNPKYKPLTNPRRNKKHNKSWKYGHRTKPSSGVTENYSSLSLPSSMEVVRVSQFVQNIAEVKQKIDK